MAPSIPECGYLYIAYGDQHVKEALNSVKSLRGVDSNAHVTIITDRRIDGFDRVIQKESFRGGFAGKVDNLTTDCYNKTLYIDTDTYFCEDCSGLFDLGNDFDICAVLDPAETELHQPGLTSYNTGVLLYSWRAFGTFKLFKQYYNDKEFLKETLKGHPASKCKTDQPSFTLAIRDTNINVHPLPDIWNARYRFNISLMGSVKIIHGPEIDYEALKKKMNYRFGNRVWEGLR